MAWTSTQASQSGNSTVAWIIGPHSKLSTHDCVVLRSEGGNEGIRIEDITVYRNPAEYRVSVRVMGSGAMRFKFAAEQMD